MRKIVIEVPDNDCCYCAASKTIGTADMREIRCPFRTSLFNIFNDSPKPVKACRDAEVSQMTDNGHMGGE